jgi:hypothetical protein
LFGKILEWIDFCDDAFEDLVENVVDTCSSLALCGDVLNKVAVKFFAVLFKKPTD